VNKCIAQAYIWIPQIVPHLKGGNLFDYVDGTHCSPPLTLVTTTDGVVSVSPNPEFLHWQMQDQLILGAIKHLYISRNVVFDESVFPLKIQPPTPADSSYTPLQVHGISPLQVHGNSSPMVIWPPASLHPLVISSTPQAVSTSQIQSLAPASTSNPGIIPNLISSQFINP
jgi:hypothetical protein